MSLNKQPGGWLISNSKNTDLQMDWISLWRRFQQICGAEILNRNLQIESRRIKVMFYGCRRA